MQIFKTGDIVTDAFVKISNSGFVEVVVNFRSKACWLSRTESGNDNITLVFGEGDDYDEESTVTIDMDHTSMIRYESWCKDQACILFMPFSEFLPSRTPVASTRSVA
jgi:hypothetical protein